MTSLLSKRRASPILSGLLAVSFLSTTLSTTMPAAADPEPQKPAHGESETMARARQSFQQAQTHYDLAEYDLAIALFRKAYELTAAPALLFNIAQAHRLQGDCAKALQVYRHFVRLDPSSTHRADADTQIKLLGAQCDAAEPESSVASQAPPAAPGAAAAGKPRGAVARPESSSDHGQPQVAPAAKGSPAESAVVLVLWSCAAVLGGTVVALQLTNDARYERWQSEDRILYHADASIPQTAFLERQRQNDRLSESIQAMDRAELALGLTAGAFMLTGAVLAIVWGRLPLRTESGRPQVGWNVRW